MNTLKRRVAMQTRSVPAAVQARCEAPSPALPHNPACVIGAEQDCRHALVDREANQRLFDYEQTVRARFSGVVDMLRAISALQHEADFVERAQAIAMQRMEWPLPEDLLRNAWVRGLDMRALHAHCQFHAARRCVRLAEQEQAPWRAALPLQPRLLAECGFHTVDVSPCADGRLQGVVPYVLRMAQDGHVLVKAYAGAMFDVESDMADWAQRELERLNGAFDHLSGAGEALRYLKVAIYHFSSAHPSEQGCAFHASNDRQSVESAAARLDELRVAIERTYGVGAAPEVLLIGLDTDLDALRIHLPDGDGDVNPHRYVDTAELYRETLGMPAEQALRHLQTRVDDAQQMGGWGQGYGSMREGMRRFVLALAQANLSQIEYVIRHHAGRYAVIGHDEEFICAGEPLPDLQLRNLFYFAHLDTVEEGAADLDVGMRIFGGLNLRHGISVPILVHFLYSSQVPGSRERAVLRATRVRDAIVARYAALAAQGMLHCRMAVSDRQGSERCEFLEDPERGSTH